MDRILWRIFEGFLMGDLFMSLFWEPALRFWRSKNEQRAVLCNFPYVLFKTFVGTDWERWLIRRSFAWYSWSLASGLLLENQESLIWSCSFPFLWFGVKGLHAAYRCCLRCCKTSSWQICSLDEGWLTDWKSPSWELKETIIWRFINWWLKADGGTLHKMEKSCSFQKSSMAIPEDALDSPQSEFFDWPHFLLVSW